MQIECPCVYRLPRPGYAPAVKTAGDGRWFAARSLRFRGEWLRIMFRVNHVCLPFLVDPARLSCVAPSRLVPYSAHSYNFRRSFGPRDRVPQQLLDLGEVHQVDHDHQQECDGIAVGGAAVKGFAWAGQGASLVTMTASLFAGSPCSSSRLPWQSVASWRHYGVGFVRKLEPDWSTVLSASDVDPLAVRWRQQQFGDTLPVQTRPARPGQRSGH